MKNQCERSDTLIPGYLDGELSEEQAAPLRKHLLSCQRCRDLAQDEQALKRWFVATEAPAVPAGFAARVARRAFAGDTGVLAGVESGAGEAVLDREERSLRLVLQLTAVAAAIMFVFALGIRNESLPVTTELDAEEPYTEVIERLEDLNASEAADAEAAEAREKARRERERGR